MPDSCTMQKIAANPNYLQALKSRFDFSNSEIITCDTVDYELTKYQISVDDISVQFFKVLGVNVVSVDSTTDEYVLAEHLIQRNSSMLHWPDNLILASAMKHNAVLLSCDRKLLHVSTIEGHRSMNTDLVGTNQFNLAQNQLPEIREPKIDQKWSVAI